ncbi:DUF6276 family protein [Natrarchaeobaculum sulfurireducens]|uniref:Uncharacterized protein n=1 Tax=Natrarchaeobaculum sulfurireducens TaxID=2044521 RepID=A0A346PBB5_9EURY|nr:DUF6276 family protein [Natrarchaeobaculum sulfurireducens]AXR76810.1 hypothetical protein AArc1_0466 [Natrarchaeobaculum sulfurireducens]
MVCSACGSLTITFAVPNPYMEYVPAAPSAASFCSRCLTLEATDSPADADPDFSRVSDAFPTRADRAVPLAIALGLCSSLVTNREAIESLFSDAEAAGTDPLLVINRLCRDPGVEPAIDLDRRAHQLEQLMYDNNG